MEGLFRLLGMRVSYRMGMFRRGDTRVTANLGFGDGCTDVEVEVEVEVEGQDEKGLDEKVMGDDGGALDQ